MSKIPLRSEIPEKYTWNLQDIFESREAWEQGYAETEKVIASFRTFEGHVAEKPVEAVKAYYELLHHLMPVMSYASLSRECDNGNSEAQAMSGRAGMLAVQARSATSFLEPELLQMTESELSGLAKNPELSDYSEYFRLLIQQKNHLLSKEEEHLLALMGHVINGPDDIFTMLSSVDMKFPDMQMPDGSIEPLTEGTYSRYRESTNREVRKMSFDHIFSTYASFGSTIAAIYGTSVKKDNALAQARHYASALNAAMDPLEIPVAVYDNLIQVIHESIPLLTRYLNLRKKLMGVDELHMYDLYAPIVEDADMVLPYEDAFNLVLEGLHPMGEDYLDVLRTARDHRWIDVYPTKDKSSGAFSMGSLADVHPYVLLNHNDNLDCAFTIAHELGHSMHSYYSNLKQPAPKRHYSLFVAEVASTCNEAVMMRHLLEKFTDRRQRAFLLNHFLEQFRTTCFRQTMFAEFERKAHEMAEKNQPLTKDTLNKAYYDLNMLYYGNGCKVDDLIANEWMRIPHFYRAYYVYVYATGLCAAVSISEKILNGGADALKHYREFLSAGCSVPPIEALKLAGIDMSTPEPLRKAMQVFAQTLDQFEEATKE